MLEKHPEILRAKARLKEAEAAAHAATLDEVAKTFLPALDNKDKPATSAQTLHDRSTQLEQQKADLQQVIRQTTHSLARFFLEVDANYKQFKTASRLRAAATQRLDAQRGITRRAGSPSTATSTRSASALRARPGSPVQDDLQHRAHGPGRSEGNVAGARSDRHCRKRARCRAFDGQAGSGDEDRVVCVPSPSPRAGCRPSRAEPPRRRSPGQGRGGERANRARRRRRQDVFVPDDDRYRSKACGGPRLVHRHPGPIARSPEGPVISPQGATARVSQFLPGESRSLPHISCKIACKCSRSVFSTNGFPPWSRRRR